MIFAEAGPPVGFPLRGESSSGMMLGSASTVEEKTVKMMESV